MNADAIPSYEEPAFDGVLVGVVFSKRNEPIAGKATGWSNVERESGLGCDGLGEFLQGNAIGLGGNFQVFANFLDGDVFQFVEAGERCGWLERNFGFGLASNSWWL